MADRQTPSRRASGKRVEAGSQSPSRRSDVIRCERCGEDYSITYKRCPFCDERPGRGISGRRAAGGGGYGGSVHPVQVIGLVVSLVLIIAALFIVFKFISPLLFGSKPSGSGSSSISSTENSSRQPVHIDSITLSETDVTLAVNEESQITASVLPAGSEAEVVWSSSRSDVLTVDQYGVIKNINSGSDTVDVTVTVTCGDQSAECVVHCGGSGAGTGTTTPGTTAAPNTTGIVSGVGSSGLNIRSGPGSGYEVLASAAEGAEVIILEDAGNGWYKINYGRPNSSDIGYVSSSYIVPKNG